MINAGQIDNFPPVAACPKCAAPSPVGADTCAHCGVIFAKVRADEDGKPVVGDQATAHHFAAPLEFDFTPKKAGHSPIK